METQDPQNSDPTPDETSKPRSLAGWSKTPEARESFLKILAVNEAKPPIYSLGYMTPEK